MSEEKKDVDWGSPGEEWTGAEVQQYIKDQFAALGEAIEKNAAKKHAPIIFKVGDSNAEYVMDVLLADQEGNEIESPKVIYLLGEAVNSWDSNNGTPVYEKDGKYVWIGELNYSSDDKLIKIAFGEGDWNAITFGVPTEVNHNGNVLKVERGIYSYMESAETEPGALKDWFWGVPEGKSGTYEITVDTDAKTISFKTLGEPQTKGFDFINKDYGLTRGSTTYLTDATLVEDVVTIQLSKSDGNGYRLWSDGLRVYKGTAQLEISVPDDYAIKKITLSGGAAGSVTAEGYDRVSKSWTGISKRVSFEIAPSATKSIETIEVELVKIS